jgi:hypothetical protein
MEPTVPVALPQHEQQITDQLVGAPNVNSLSLDKMLKSSSNSSKADYESLKVLCHYKNCLKSHGAKWSIEFIGVFCYTEPGLTKTLYCIYIQ